MHYSPSDPRRFFHVTSGARTFTEITPASPCHLNRIYGKLDAVRRKLSNVRAGRPNGERACAIPLLRSALPVNSRFRPFERRAAVTTSRCIFDFNVASITREIKKKKRRTREAPSVHSASVLARVARTVRKASAVFARFVPSAVRTNLNRLY